MQHGRHVVLHDSHAMLQGRHVVLQECHAMLHGRHVVVQDGHAMLHGRHVVLQESLAMLHGHHVVLHDLKEPFLLKIVKSRELKPPASNSARLQVVHQSYPKQPWHPFQTFLLPSLQPYHACTHPPGRIQAKNIPVLTNR
jgi:hypothetical protein